MKKKNINEKHIYFIRFTYQKKKWRKKDHFNDFQNRFSFIRF